VRSYELFAGFRTPLQKGGNACFKPDFQNFGLVLHGHFLIFGANCTAMRQVYEKPETEMIVVEEANFFCTTPVPTNGLPEMEGEEW
jgi:hypothetical protein